MKAFEIKVNGKVLDYRVTKQLDLKEVEDFFSKSYRVKKIWQENRHVLGIIEIDGKDAFLKLATTPGISAVTQTDYSWNREFNSIVSRDVDFWVPQNIESGFYINLFYMITEYFDGPLFAKRPAPDKIEQILLEDLYRIVEFSELIGDLGVGPLSQKDNEGFQSFFLEKTKSWLNAVLKKVIEEYKVIDLLKIVEDGYDSLDKKTRHGDFTPWHMIKLNSGQIGLIDGEHAMRNGVEHYDIGYLIQRIYSVLENPQLAKNLLNYILKRGYDLKKLKVILAARAIGGFCDETLINKDQNFPRANKFSQWVLRL